MERKKTLSSPLPAEVKQLLREDDTLGVSQLDEPGDNVLSDGQKPGGGDGER